MGFYAVVETDLSINLGIYLSENLISGKLLSSFIEALSTYLDEKPSENDEYSQWFRPIEKDISDLAVLSQAYYYGEWNYKAWEYDQYVEDHPQPQMDIPREGFSKMIEDLDQKWTDLDQMIDMVIKLNHWMMTHSCNLAWWYVPGETEKELISLEKTLCQAKEKGAKRIRIQFV